MNLNCKYEKYIYKVLNDNYKGFVYDDFLVELTSFIKREEVLNKESLRVNKKIDWFKKIKLINKVIKYDGFISDEEIKKEVDFILCLLIKDNVLFKEGCNYYNVNYLHELYMEILNKFSFKNIVDYELNGLNNDYVMLNNSLTKAVEMTDELERILGINLENTSSNDLLLNSLHSFAHKKNKVKEGFICDPSYIDNAFNMYNKLIDKQAGSNIRVIIRSNGRREALKKKYDLLRFDYSEEVNSLIDELFNREDFQMIDCNNDVRRSL